MKSKNNLVSKIALVILFSITSVGCGSAYFKIGTQTQSFSQGSGTFNNQLDILWVVDNSLSMDPLQNNMVANFGSIITMFQAKGYDFHMAVTTSDAYLGDPTLNGYSPGNAPLSLFRDGVGANHSGVFVMTPATPNINSVFVTNATQGSGGSGDERPFSSFRAALSNPLNPSFLRPDAFLSVIILSDEDDFSGNSRGELSGTDHDYSAATLDPIQTYINYLDQVTHSTSSLRRYNVNSIVVSDNNCLTQLLQSGKGSILGQRMMALSQQTSGIIGSICDISFANSLSAIASQIISLSTQFHLEKTPQVESIIVQVNKVIIVQDKVNGWTFDSVANSILFHGTAIPSQGSSISVSFTPVKI